MKIKPFNQISQSAVYCEASVSVSITCFGGSCGGGSEVLVVHESCEDDTKRPVQRD